MGVLERIHEGSEDILEESEEIASTIDNNATETEEEKLRNLRENIFGGKQPLKRRNLLTEKFETRPRSRKEL